MSKSNLRIKGTEYLRILMTIVFLLLGMAKIYVLSELGFKPYEAIVKAANLPSIVKYYGLIAVLIEFYLVFGIWSKKHCRISVLLALGLTAAGTLLSAVLLVFKINSDCGCGLLGGSEYGLLAQKIIIMLGLMILYKNERILFVDKQTSLSS